MKYVTKIRVILGFVIFINVGVLTIVTLHIGDTPKSANTQQTGANKAFMGINLSRLSFPFTHLPVSASTVSITSQKTNPATITTAPPTPTASSSRSHGSVTAFASLFPDFASFNFSASWCRVISGGNYVYQFIGDDYREIVYGSPNFCATQWYSDQSYLYGRGIKMLRIWARIGQFMYDQDTDTYKDPTTDSKFHNFDAQLAFLEQLGFKLYVTVDMAQGCSTNLPSNPTPTDKYNHYKKFNERIVQDATFQDQYITGLQAFFNKYKNDSHIIAYDLINEVSVIINSDSGSPIGVQCGNFYDSPNLPKFGALIQRMYSTVKSIDSMHPVTFSFASDKKANFQLLYKQVFDSSVDFYDVHAYSPSTDPAAGQDAFYSILPTYDKPLIHGEIGWEPPTTITDSQGNNCSGEDVTATPPAIMGSECQAKWLANTQAWIAAAKSHNIPAVFFHQWPATNRYGYRTYDSNNVISSHVMAPSGEAVLGAN